MALELSLGRFLDASVKDFSYFLGSVGAFGYRFWGNFGVIFGSWGALGRQRAPETHPVPNTILWCNILGSLLETKILKNPPRAVPGRIFLVFLTHRALHRFFYLFLSLSRPPRTSKIKLFQNHTFARFRKSTSRGSVLELILVPFWEPWGRFGASGADPGSFLPFQKGV